MRKQKQLKPLSQPSGSVPVCPAFTSVAQGWTSRSLFKASSTCHLNLFVVSPGALLLCCIDGFLCDSSLPSKHTCHSILYLSKQKIWTKYPFLALFYFSASFRANSPEEFVPATSIFLSPFSRVVTFAPRMPLKLPLVKVTLNLPGAKCVLISV